jgi:hypothetical protein
MLIVGDSMKISACILLLACASTACVRRTGSQPYFPDHELFPLVVQMLRDSTAGELRVDPRPLKPDPSLVMLDARLDEIAPTAVTAPGGPLLTTDSSFVKRRETILAGLRISITDALRNNECPGALAAPLPAIEKDKLENCPRIIFGGAIIAVPRPGGVFWPGNFDERADDKGDVWSVRVIRQDIGPNGLIAVALDYVFVREGTWRFIHIRHLFIIE